MPAEASGLGLCVEPSLCPHSSLGSLFCDYSAFQTPTGMPYGTVNLLHGVNPGETPVTCTAGIGTFIVEFATLSSLTGDPVFEDVARVALTRLWESRSDIGLVGRLLPFLSESSRPP